MKFFGRPFGFWLLTIVGLTIAFAMVYVLRFKYWQSNFRLLSSSWNLYRVLRSNGMLKAPSATSKTGTTDICSQAAFFREFCDYWANDTKRPQRGSLQFNRNSKFADIDDEKLMNSVNRVPLEYAMFTTLTTTKLREHWQKFITNRCSSYYDKLICQNGIVFDWTNKSLIAKSPPADKYAPP